MKQIQCSHCGSSKFRKGGFDTFSDGSKVRRYICRNCCRSFTSQPRFVPAEPADAVCPSCESERTVKLSKLTKRKHITVQRCKCKDCGREFVKDGRKRLELYLNGKLIHSFWQNTGLRHVPGISCPNCGQQKAILKSIRRDGQRQKQVHVTICLGCGQHFTGEGRSWPTQIKRLLGKAVPRQPWQFEDDEWDLRELYRELEVNKTRTTILCFYKSGEEWYKTLLKKYLLWRIKRGAAPSTLAAVKRYLAFFGSYLQRQSITQIENISREHLLTYWSQERSHLSPKAHRDEMYHLKAFFEWGDEEKLFNALPNLVTSLFDTPKVFRDEPDPLEDSVLQAIRDNVHILPEPLQIQFMLGAWLGTRPSELSFIMKDCIIQEPDSWWIVFERDKSKDKHKLPLPKDFVQLIFRQQDYINELFGEDYPYLFCHYRKMEAKNFPDYPELKPVRRPPIPGTGNNSMVRAIRQLIEYCDIKDSNGKLAHFTGAILRPTRASELIANGYSLEFVRIWLKHRSQTTTKQYYTSYPPGEMLDVATVMANVDAKLYPYDTNPKALREHLEDLRQHPEMHELDGLTMTNREPLYGYCLYREFCPRFGYCYTCPSHIASADKLPEYRAQLERIKANESLALKYWSGELLEIYQKTAAALEGIVRTLEAENEPNKATG